MSFIPAAKHLAASIVLSAAVVPGATAAAAYASSARILGPCAVSVGNPNHAGNHVWIESHWNCSTQPADGGTKIHLRIIRDGSVVKTSEFWRKGPFDQTYGTGVACVGGSHTYMAHAWGFDSDLIQYHAHSPELTLPC
ncbi:hypothetical protein [Actinomadura oligospora]|uniref:hypothetical protein n=1 Tax=Actinomadura oligospora TaxID=111804 RepID=UPI0012F8F766|nr:hypothetical protein [Actinomadura oligospora]